MPEYAGETGCLIDSHHGQYMYGMVVDIARNHGYQPSPYYLTHVTLYNKGLEGTEAVVDEADRAEVWLNEHVAAEGHSFGWEDGEFYYQSDEWWEDDEPLVHDDRQHEPPFLPAPFIPWAHNLPVDTRDD